MEDLIVPWSVVLRTIPEADLHRFQIVALTPALGVEAKLLSAAMVLMALSTNARSMPNSMINVVRVCPGVRSARLTIPTNPAKMTLIMPATTSLKLAVCR